MPFKETGGSLVTSLQTPARNHMSRLSNMQDFNNLKTRMNGSFPLRVSSKKRFASQSLFLLKTPLKMQCRLVALKKSLNLLAGKTCHPRIDCFAVALCIKIHMGLLCSLFLAKDVSFQVESIKRTLQICISTAHAGSVWRQEVIDACQVLLFVNDLSEKMSEDTSEDMSERMSKDMSEDTSEDMSERMSKDMSERMSEDCFQSVREVESNRTHFRR